MTLWHCSTYVCEPHDLNCIQTAYGERNQIPSWCIPHIYHYTYHHGAFLTPTTTITIMVHSSHLPLHLPSWCIPHIYHYTYHHDAFLTSTTTITIMVHSSHLPLLFNCFLSDMTWLPVSNRSITLHITVNFGKCFVKNHHGHIFINYIYSCIYNTLSIWLYKYVRSWDTNYVVFG